MKETALASSPEQGLDSIAARLLEVGLGDGKSFVSSPACLQVALEALARGTEAETLAEIDAVLGGEDAREAAHAALFSEPSESPSDDYSFTIGTSIWDDPDQAPLRESYAESIGNMNGKAVEANPASERRPFADVELARREHRRQVHVGTAARRLDNARPHERDALQGHVDQPPERRGGGDAVPCLQFNADRHDDGWVQPL